MNWRHRDELGAFLNEAGLTSFGVEVGSQAGIFAATVLAKWRGRGLTLVDPWEFQPRSTYADIGNDPTGQAGAFTSARRLAESDVRVRLLRGYSPDVAERFPDGSLDFVYIDGNHSYPAVTADLHAWYPKVRPGGMFAGHDYLDGIIGGCLFGVRTAVNDFAESLGLTVAFTVADPPFVSWYFRKPIGPPPSPHRVTVLTAYDAGFATVGDISRANKVAYCARHGYRFVCRTDGFDEERPPSWAKVKFIREELGAADWIFWTDADALVMNASIPVTRFVQDCVDVVFSGDPTNGINCGHMLFRSTAWSERFLEHVYARTEFLHHPWWENAAVLKLYAEDPDVRRHTAVVPNKLFNGYPYPGAGYTSGDFVVHFAGLKATDREAAMRSYAAMAR